MNYIRISECIYYFFFKNFVEGFSQFLYGFYCNFTGQTIIDDWFLTLYNLLFTSLPLGTKAILDIDLTRDDGIIVYKLLPFIYKENRDNPMFTFPKFILYLLKGVVFCLINTYFVIFSLYHNQINKKGKIGGLWFMSVDLYSNILIIVTITLIVTTRFHTWIHFAILGVVTVLSYVIFLIIVQYWSIFNSVGTISVAFSSPVLWLNEILICGCCGLIEYFIICFSFIFQPNTVSILKTIIAEKGIINTKEHLPKSIKEKIQIYDNINNDKIEGLVEDKQQKQEIEIHQKINDDNIDNKIGNNNNDNSIKDNIDNNNIDISINFKIDNIINIDKISGDEKLNEKNSNRKIVDNRFCYENSKDVFIRKKSSERNFLNEIEMLNKNNISNRNKNNGKLNESNDLGENLTDSFSEQMSKEKHLYISNESYFNKPKDLKHKIFK
jgi:hypothetical protein